MESVHPNSSGQTAQDYQGFLAPRPDFGRTGVSDQRAWPPQAVNKISSFLPWFHYFLKLSFTLFIFFNYFCVECGCVGATVCVCKGHTTSFRSRVSPHTVGFRDQTTSPDRTAALGLHLCAEPSHGQSCLMGMGQATFASAAFLEVFNVLWAFQSVLGNMSVVNPSPV